MATFDAQLPPFDLSTALILITGGSSGIGLGLVEEFTSRGSRVLITGRREQELKKVQQNYGSDKVLKYYVSNAGSEDDRIKLFQQSTNDFPDLNVVINNAGIQRRGDHSKEIAEDWKVRQEEIDINFSGSIHLTSLFISHMLSLPTTRPSAIINVTSGLAYVPFSHGPVYSATRAGLHQYTQAIRPLLAETSCRIVELIPPAVKSNLGGSHDFGEECDVFCKSVVEDFAKGKVEFGFRASEGWRVADRKTLAAVMMGFIKHLNIPLFKQ
jgi:uncharacterized oxidoreductase